MWLLIITFRLPCFQFSFSLCPCLSLSIFDQSYLSLIPILSSFVFFLPFLPYLFPIFLSIPIKRKASRSSSFFFFPSSFHLLLYLHKYKSIFVRRPLKFKKDDEDAAPHMSMTDDKEYLGQSVLSTHLTILTLAMPSLTSD